jgi:hypothetical protein
MCFFAPAKEGRRSARKSGLIFRRFYQTEKFYRRVRFECQDTDYAFAILNAEDLSGLSHNA